MLPPAPLPPVLASPDAIVAEVCRSRSVDLETLLAPAGGRWITDTRRLIARRLRDELGMALTEIARRLGLENHTSVIYLLRTAVR